MKRAHVILAAVVLTAAAVAAIAAPSPPPSPSSSSPPPSPAAPAATVKIIFITVPMKKAMVFWGKKRLGMIAPHAPFVLQRPRDSGPLDLVVRADGYLPVQTRAYTFADSKIAVKLTPLDQKNTVLGYREEVPPDGGVPDGGAPLAAPAPHRPDGGAR